MRLYLDDDCASGILTAHLRAAGHDVQLPRDAGLSGADDAVHLTHTIREDRVIVSRNYQDFENLHNLLVQGQGHHPGIFVIRQDNDPRRSMTPRGIVQAISNLPAANIPIPDSYIILNQWR
jgi:hypothetical protein